METKSPAQEPAARVHQLTKQILREVAKLQGLVISVAQKNSTSEIATVRQEYLEPLYAIAEELSAIGGLDALLERFTRAALSLNLDVGRRKFRNIEASSVHVLAINICGYLLLLWNRAFSLKPGDPVPEAGLNKDVVDLCNLLDAAMAKMGLGGAQLRQCFKVTDPSVVGLRQFLQECYICLNEWNPTSLVADLEREYVLSCTQANVHPKAPQTSEPREPEYAAAVRVVPDIDREKLIRSMKPSVRLAYLAFCYAESKAGKRLEDREAYELLSEEGIPEVAGDRGELTDYRLPGFGTWTRQLREARPVLGEQKYTRRGGRPTGRSIVKGDQIERQHGSE